MIEEEPPIPTILNNDTAFVLVCSGCAALLGQFAEFPREGDGRMLAHLLTGSHRAQSLFCAEATVVGVKDPHDAVSTNLL